MSDYAARFDIAIPMIISSAPGDESVTFRTACEPRIGAETQSGGPMNEEYPDSTIVSEEFKHTGPSLRREKVSATTFFFPAT